MEAGAVGAEGEPEHEEEDAGGEEEGEEGGADELDDSLGEGPMDRPRDEQGWRRAEFGGHCQLEWAAVAAAC